MKKTLILLSIVAAALSAACQRDPILYPTSDYYVAVRVAVDARADSAAKAPSLYSVNFYDTLTHHRVLQAFITPASHPEGLPEGGYVQGIEPGTYDMLVYNYDTRVTSVESEDYYPSVHARTGVAARSGDTPVVYAPDHLYVYSGRVTVPYITADDGVYVIESVLTSVVEPWRVIVNGIRGLDMAQGLTFLLSGQTRGRVLADRTPVQERAIVMFAGAVATRTKGGDDLYVYTPYTTFGRYGDDSRCLMTLQIAGPNDAVYYVQEDVTQQVLDKQDGDRTIVIDADVEVRPRQEGGFAPVADPWKPDVTHIVLE